MNVLLKYDLIMHTLLLWCRNRDTGESEPDIPSVRLYNKSNIDITRRITT
jgi:hypothetical protein